jgi:protein required for attachment to host cells
MNIPPETHVLVMDGSKMLLFRNRGSEVEPVLETIDTREQDSAATRDQGTSGPGSTFQSAGSARSSYEQTDFHQMDEDRFAVDAADMLNRMVLQHKMDKLIIVAAPRTLGELRKHLHGEVEKRVIGEISKDLAGHPTGDILAAITSA